MKDFFKKFLHNEPPTSFYLAAAIATIIVSNVFIVGNSLAENPEEASEEIVTKSAPCIDGMAGKFLCSNIDLLSALNLEKSGAPASVGSDIWGWTDPQTAKNYAIMGLSNKTAFVDITDPTNPIHIGDLPGHSHGILWRDIKVYNDHAFIVSEAMMHGMQVFDLRQLRSYDGSAGPMILYPNAHYGYFGSAHNIGINEETGFAYIVGTHTCDMGVHVVNIQDPQNPRFSTCIDREVFTRDENYQPAEPAEETDRPEASEGRSFSGFSPVAAESSPVLRGIIARKEDALRGSHDEAYTHDIQCVVYRGPDHEHHGKEICVASNDDTINIVDVTDKANPIQLSATKYPEWGFIHQGWLTPDHAYFLLGDEIDEKKFELPTRTLIFNVQDLDNPSQPVAHTHATNAIDHNLYTKGNLVYEANYTAGVRILKLDRVHEGVLEEVGFFDTVPENDDPQFWGIWSVYPYFDNGVLIASGMDGVLYTIQQSLPAGMIRP